MDLAFNKKLADSRKKWLYNFDNNNIINHLDTEIPIPDFINKELIHFSNSDTLRSIGSVFDGLKPSQRKILYSCFKRKLYSEIRVAQLSGYVSENAAYHHGEMSLQSAIIGMAQNFVGSNNINILEPNGQFGTRIMGGSDAASSRYIHTELNKLSDCIFPSADFPVLDYTEDDGCKVEPYYYVPIVPLVLINGMTGIGTGFSTNIPSFNPIDICKNIRNIIGSKEYMNMKPWFKGFTGSIIQTGDKTYMSKGVYNILNNTTIEITELPIGRWTEDYKDILNKLVIDRSTKEGNKGIIVDYENQSTDTIVYFKIYLKPGYLSSAQWSEDNIDKIEKDFKLTSTKNTSLTNIHLYNETHTITKYEDIESIMREYCRIRINLYAKRKVYKLDILDKEIHLLSEKCRFILDIINGNLCIQQRTKDNIIQQLNEKEYTKINNTYDYLLRLPIYTLSQEEIDTLMKDKDNIISERQQLFEMTSTDLWLFELSQFEKYYKKFLKK